MKTLKQILVTIFVLTLITACDKDENDPKENEPKGILDKATISAKWNVNNFNDYYSFEFNESGNYIVVKNTTTESTNDQIILFGTYKIIDSKTIVLSDFGTLILSKIDENSISFSIKLTSNSNSEIIISASKQEEMGSSTKTDLLSRTWEVISINGEIVAGTEDEIIVMFSKAGTYLVWADDGGGLAQWKWKNEAETQFLYSWDEVPVWEGEDYVEIIELTNSTLKIFEESKDQNESELYVLKPIVNNRSARINSSLDITKKSSRKGLLKK